jgi:prepilin-type N-terminal cleavage/methylation domain-containing protein
MPSAESSLARRGFTMVELLVTVVILVLVTSITYGVFSAVSKAWQRGLALSDDLHHGDYIMEQLVMGLRSAYYNPSNPNDAKYGFWLEDEGSGESARDTIAWVKLGSSLVGERSEVAKGAHRVKFTVRTNPETDEPGAAITAWSPEAYLQPEDFDPDQLDPVFLSSRIVGFNCRIATNSTESELEWEDDWELTNTRPPFIELTLYLKPLQEGEAPVEMKRSVAIPVAEKYWKK